jgi:hypothetical protein
VLVELGSGDFGCTGCRLEGVAERSSLDFGLVDGDIEL